MYYAVNKIFMSIKIFNILENLFGNSQESKSKMTYNLYVKEAV